ncbi:DUF1822 family protein [Kamptonema sp. UHCC 0994]|uniref:DUF1822 family protein n=1 Tax=Kamptonema sp. UHCC 0994 TaxID=3031329 RepID=UPI0023B8964B|nr:DUF1822 family protein [Kamptonema sp. UHCC 0994]MDF0554937.1 DUF1822 family protein [Kamptonema sp. UHCC 0994]
MQLITEPLTFTVPLSFEAHALAQDYCQQQSNPQKAKQVYLNTLAVYATNYYLQCMGFETNWEASDSRIPLMVKLLDIADLDVNQLGKIECRPVLPDAKSCQIPPDVWQDRIGYVAVQLNQSLKEATLLGFTKTATAEISLNQLQTLDNFLSYLNQLHAQKVVNFSNWFQGTFEEGWRTIGELLNLKQPELAVRFRNAVSIVRGQQIDLGMQLSDRKLALVITLPPEAKSEIDIIVQVHPMESQTYLPEGVKLIILDESGDAVLEAKSREADNFIQLAFSAETGESFSVQVALEAANITQQFVV